LVFFQAFGIFNYFPEINTDGKARLLANSLHVFWC